MQQAYRVLRVVAEAQTIRIVLMLKPNELMLKELCTACSSLNTESSSGIKAVVLDFKETSGEQKETVASDNISRACAAVQAVEAPVLAVVRDTLSAPASKLAQAADFILIAHEAVLTLQALDNRDGHKADGAGISLVNTRSTVDTVDQEIRTCTGAQALRLRLATWSVLARDIDTEMERILTMLREKSAAALRHAKTSVRLAAQHPPEDAASRLEALKRVNEFYLTQVMQTADAREGLHSFLEKRKPQWKNR